jgi:hypothetical protein
MKLSFNDTTIEISVNGKAVSPAMRISDLPVEVRDFLMSIGYICRLDIRGKTVYTWTAKANQEFEYAYVTGQLG